MLPWDSSKKVPEEAKVSSPEFQGYDLPYCPDSSSQNTELHDLMVAVAKPSHNSHVQPVLPGW